VTIADISPAAVLHAIRAGKRTKADLADAFDVLPTSLFLGDALGTLIATEQIRVNEHGEYIPHDLFDTLEDQ
jgi:hypothetical protein